MGTKKWKSLEFGIIVAVFLFSKFSQIASQAGKYDPGAADKTLTNLDEIQGFSYTPDEMTKLKLWDNGVVPYFIDVYSFDKVLRDRIRQVFRDASNYGGVRFTELNKPPANESDRYVFLINRKGHSVCSPPPYYNMTTKGIQKVVLGYDCMAYGDLVSITLSILGIPPMHNAPFRDDYVQVNVDNVLPGKEYLFQKLPKDKWLFYEDDIRDLGYDFDSATHFQLHQYTSNGKATIIPLNKTTVPVGSSLGEPEKFSYGDVQKMRVLYNYLRYQYGHLDSDDCSQLFKPGNYTNNLSSHSDEQKSPRPKPCHYTGEDCRGGKKNKWKTKEYAKKTTPKDKKKMKLNMDDNAENTTDDYDYDGENKSPTTEKSDSNNEGNDTDNAEKKSTVADNAEKKTTEADNDNDPDSNTTTKKPNDDKAEDNSKNKDSQEETTPTDENNAKTTEPDRRMFNRRRY